MENTIQTISVFADVMPDISPTYGNTFPIMSTLLEWAGAIQGVALVVTGILLIVGVCSWVGGKLAGAQAAQRVGVVSLICAGVGAMLIGSSFALIRWGATQEIINTAAGFISNAASF